MKEIGPLFKDLLRIKNIDQKDLAPILGMSPQAISLLLKGGADKWKLDNFENVCNFLHVHPKTFFDSWNDSGNTVMGNIDNNAFFGESNFTMSTGNENEELNHLLRQSIKDKETIISLQNQILELKDQLNNARELMMSKDSL